MPKWTLAESQKQDGQLGRTEKFLPNCSLEDLRAAEIIVPVKQEPNQSLGGIASYAVRTLELMWDEEKKQLRVWITSNGNDMEAYKNGFKTSYPGLVIEDLDETMPHWFDKTVGYQIFDASLRHGHFFTVMDGSKEHSLVSSISSKIQQTRYAWVQFVFKRHDIASIMQRVGRRMDSMKKEVSRTNHVGFKDSVFSSKGSNHPEFGGEFAQSYEELRRHSKTKVAGVHIVMSVRGMVLPHQDAGIPDCGFESIGTNFEHVTQYEYDPSLFYNPEQKKARHIKVGNRKTGMQRIDIFPRRLLPAPKEPLSKAVDQYVGKKARYSISYAQAAGFFDPQPT